MEWELRFNLHGHQDIGWIVSAQETYGDYQWTYEFTGAVGYSRGYLQDFFRAEAVSMVLFRANCHASTAWQFRLGRPFIMLESVGRNERVRGGIYVG